MGQAMSSAEKGELIVDLSFAKLTMPANGVYVVFEALLTKPGEQFISTTIGENEAVVITGTDVRDPATYSTTKLADYPTIHTAESADPSTSWAMGSNKRGWSPRVATAKGRYQHLLISLVLSN